MIMVVKAESGEPSSRTKYNFSRKAGKNIVEYKPVFSPDGQSVVVTVENVVRVYSLQTGDCVRTLETEQHIKSLISVRFPKDNEFNLFGCSNNGIVTVWTWASGAVLREINLQLPPTVSKVLTFDLIDADECFIIASQVEEPLLFIASFSTRTGCMSVNYRNTHLMCYEIISVSFGICDGDKYAVVCNGTKTILVQNLNQPHLKAPIHNHNELRVISVSAHPSENAVAITDTLGRVTLLKGYLFDYHNLAREVMHWHFLPTLASCFSSEGSYLYTGGLERVLIKWTVGNLARDAQEKQFIPRLPGVVRHITTSNTHVAISLTNNAIVIASAQMRVVGTILECGGLSPVARSLGTALVYHRPSAALLLGGRTGHLQMYSTATDKLLYNIDVTQVNNIPPMRHNLLPLDLEVICAAVSADGSWLVTSEYRNDDVMYPEERLKFWTVDDKGIVPFKLNTCVNLSHGGCKVVSLALSNTGDFCVSAGDDQKFRIWKREKVTDERNKQHYWRCLTACYYSSGFSHSVAHEILNNFKNSEYNKSDKVDSQWYMHNAEPNNDIIHKIMSVNKDDRLVPQKRDDLDSEMSGVAISQDGSLIAAWFGCKLTLWDTHLCNLRTSLAHPVLRPKGLQVQFGNHDAAHYLVCTTEQSLSVWSLLSLTMKWFVALRPSCLTADPFSNRMAVVTDENDVIVFTPHNSKPILKRERLLASDSGVISQCAFGAPAGDDVRLYLMRNDSEIYALEPEQHSSGQLEVLSRRNIPASNFSALLAEQRLSEVQSRTPAGLDYLDADGLGKSAIAQFLSAAPHMMPPVTLLCTSFLEHISGRERPPEVAEPVADTMEVDDTSSDDEEEKKEKTPVKKPELWTANYEHVKEKKLKRILKGRLDNDVTVSLFGT